MEPQILTRHCTVRLTRIDDEWVRQNDDTECSLSEESFCGSEANNEPDAISNIQESSGLDDCNIIDMDAESNGKLPMNFSVSN